MALENPEKSSQGESKIGSNSWVQSLSATLTDSSSNKLLSQFKEMNRPNDLPVVSFVSTKPDEKAEAKKEGKVEEKYDAKKERDKLVDAAAGVLTQAVIEDGYLKSGGNAAQFLGKVIKHQSQFHDGSKHADALAKEITDKLPEGMKLKISEDEALNKKVQDECRRLRKTAPEYIRKVELVGKDGKSLGSFDLTAN